MFKAEIRSQDRKLLQGRFQGIDYPLISFIFHQDSFKWKAIRDPIITGTIETRKDEKYMLEICVPEELILQINGSPSTKFSSSSGAKPSTELMSPTMRSIIIDILNCSFKMELRKPYLKAKVAELLIQIFSAQVSDPTYYNLSEQDRKSLEKVKDLMGQNLKASYSIEELAIVAGMNRTKLQQGFKNLYNKTIYTFLLDLKMAEAKTLLTKENTLSLKEIAALVGYKHVNHFSAAFKKKYEMSPAYFKKVIQCFFPLFFFGANI